MRQPDLLLMDEPMSNLDAKLRTALRSEVLMLQRRLGITTVYVTHDQVEAMALGDRVAVMRNGRIVQCGPPVDVYRWPKDTFVAQFIGSPPINLLAGRVVDDDAGVGLSVGSHLISLTDVEASWIGLDGRVGQEIIVGIRPDAFRRDPNGEFVLSVRFHEQLGTTQWVHADIDAPVIDTADTEKPAGPTLVAALEGRGQVSLWEPLRLGVDHRQIHLFDPVTGLALNSKSHAGPANRQASGSTVTGTPLRAMLPLTGS